MKKSLLFFMITISITLGASNLNFDISTYNKNFSMNNQVYYQTRLSAYDFNFQGNHYSQRTNVFDRDQKGSQYIWSLGRKTGYVTNYLNYGYSFEKNHSQFEDTLQTYKKQSQSISYKNTFAYSFFNTSAEIKYLQLQNDKGSSTQKISKGYFYGLESTYLDSLSSELFKGQLSYSEKNLDYDYRKILNSSLKFSKQNDFLNLYINTNADYGKYSIFNYQEKIDYQKRINLTNDLEFNLSFPFISNFTTYLLSQSDYRNTRYDNKVTKNVFEFFQNSELLSEYKKDYYSLKFKFIKAYSKKNYPKQNILILNETTGISPYLTYFFNPTDSIYFNYYQDINRITYPEENNIFDNDKTNNLSTVVLYNNIKNYIGVKNSFSYQVRKDIYLAQEMSGTNFTRTSYTWQPETEIEIFRNIFFLQKYSLKADYYDYYWEEGLQDYYYRRLNMALTLEKKEFYQNLFYNYGLEFRLEDSDTGTKFDEEQYLQLNRRTSSVYSLHLIQNYHSLYFKLLPELTISDNKEINFISELGINTESLSLKILVNPLISDQEETIWKSSMEIFYNF